MTPRYLVIAHHVSHLFPDVVSRPMSFWDAHRIAERVPGGLPPGAHGWTVTVQHVGVGARPQHLYRRD